MASNRDSTLRAFSVLFAFWLALAGAPASAAAQPEPGPPPSEPSLQDKETARNLMDFGRDKYGRGDYAGALQDFTGADNIMHVTSTGLWMGKALMQLGRLIEARDKLLKVARIERDPNESSILAQARSEAARLQQQLADRIPELKLEVRGVPPGAKVDVTVDDAAVPPAALAVPVKVDPGTHTIRASSAGYHDLQLTVSMREAERQTVTLSFEKRGLSAAQSDPAGDTPETVGLSPLAWVGFGVGAAGLIVGSITGGLSLAAASDAKEGCIDITCPTANKPDADRSLALAHASTVSFVVAGVGVTVGIVALLLSGGGEAPTDVEATQSGGVTVEPLVGPGFVGVSGRF